MELKSLQFIQALRRMVKEKGAGVYYSNGMLKASLADYATDTSGLKNERIIFYNTVVTETMAGISLSQAVRDFSNDFDLEKQKNWMRWLKDCGVREENAAFAIVCLKESFSDNQLTEDDLNKNIAGLAGVSVISKVSEKKSTQESTKTPTQETSYTPTEDKKNGREIGYLIALVVFILIVGIIWFFRTGKSDSKDSSDMSYEEFSEILETDEGKTGASDETLEKTESDTIESGKTESENIESEKTESQKSENEITEDQKSESDMLQSAAISEAEKGNNRINLSSLEPIKVDGGYNYVFYKSSVTEDTLRERYTDNYGNRYSVEDTISQAAGIGDGYVEFYLNGDYKYLDFTTYVSAGSADYQKDDERITIYGDDKVLFEYGDFDYKTKPFETTIDIRGVEYLSIKTKWLGRFGISNMYLYK